MKVSMSTTIDIDHNTSAGELAKFFASLPPLAKVSVTEEKYQSPREPGRSYITARWTETR